MNKIKSILREQYDLEITTVSPQQGGWAALAYKVHNNKHTYFLKVYEKSRASTPELTSLIDEYVPIMIWLMHNSGLKGKIPVPLVTRSGNYKYEDDDSIYMLYEYIVGETIGKNDLTEDQIGQLSEIISKLHLHGQDIPIDTNAVKEDFIVPFLDELRSTLGNECKHFPVDIREVIQPHIEQIHVRINAVEKLSAYLKTSNLRMALCHTDIHNWNLMQTESQLVLIDWEGLKLAPVEADLMFFVDQPYFDDFLNIYRKYHTNYVISTDALQFYRGRRKLEDIWQFIQQLLFDKQDENDRSVTLNYLAKELNSIND